MTLSPEFGGRGNQEIFLNKTIFPFADASSLKKGYTKGFFGFFYYSTEKLLILPFKEVEPIPISLRLQEYPDNGLSITPFNPTVGYILSEEDSDLTKRREKLMRSLHERRVNPYVPLVLLIDISLRRLLNAGVSGWNLNDLHCKVSAGQEYEACATFRIQQKSIDFDGGFYPIATGPLPADTLEGGICGETIYDETTGELTVGMGHDLLFANNPAEMSQIGISFHIH